MSRKHPYDGPSLSNAPYKKPKPMTDEELAAWQIRKVLEMEQTMRDAARHREFSRRVRTLGLLGALGLAGPPVADSANSSRIVRRV